MREIKFIVLHCTAGPQAQTTKSILDYWKNKLKWKSVGYHFLISGNGSYEQLSPIDKPTNGVAGFNANSIHVCYKGGWNGKDTRTPEQKQSMIDIVRNLKKQFPNARVVGHRDFSPDLDGDGVIEPHEFLKLCPCFDAAQFAKENNL